MPRPFGEMRALSAEARSAVPGESINKALAVILMWRNPVPCDFKVFVYINTSRERSLALGWTEDTHRNQHSVKYLQIQIKMLSCLKNTDTATPCPNGSGQPTENHADDKPKLQKTVSLSTAGHSSPNVKDPKVLVINTGGTIGMMEHENGLSPKANVFVETLRKLSFLHDEQYAQQKRLKKDILVLPQSKQKKRIEYTVLEYTPLLDSCNMDKEDWARIGKDIEKHYEEYNGFVVLHGTDTMAYTTSALSFMCENLGKPVIFTGSQVPIFERRNDGRENLLEALVIAGEFPIPEVCLYFHHKLYRGNRVTKVDSGSFDAFTSPNLPPLANAEVDIKVEWDTVVRPNPTAKFTVNTQWNSNVGLLRLFPGITADTVKAFLQPMDGIVLETYGSGNAPDNRPDLLDAIREATERGLIMINCTQCQRGTVTNTYATGQALHKAGVIAGCDMTAEAALSKLSYVLAKQDLSTEEKKEMLMCDLRGEMTADLVDSRFVQVIANNLTISRKKGVLTSAVPTDGLAEADRLTLGLVKVLGVTAPVTRVTLSVTGQPDADLPFTYNAEGQELQFDATSQSHTIEKPFTITWNEA